eukprot:3570271-Prymnesium_polylepis.1
MPSSCATCPAVSSSGTRLYLMPDTSQLCWHCTPPLHACQAAHVVCCLALLVVLGILLQLLPLTVDSVEPCASIVARST